MGSQSLVNRLLTGSLFAASCLGTLALFGAVPMLPHLTARLSGILPDRSELASEPSQPQANHQSRVAWIAQLPDNQLPDNQLPDNPSLENPSLGHSTAERSPAEFWKRSAALQRYRLPQ